MHPCFKTTSTRQNHEQTPTEILYVSIFSSTSILYLYLYMKYINIQKSGIGHQILKKNQDNNGYTVQFINHLSFFCFLYMSEVILLYCFSLLWVSDSPISIQGRRKDGCTYITPVNFNPKYFFKISCLSCRDIPMLGGKYLNTVFLYLNKFIY
jgi:hypothetical protein